jgi:hypothetical protein
MTRVAGGLARLIVVCWEDSGRGYFVMLPSACACEIGCVTGRLCGLLIPAWKTLGPRATSPAAVSPRSVGVREVR